MYYLVFARVFFLAQSRLLLVFRALLILGFLHSLFYTLLFLGVAKNRVLHDNTTVGYVDKIKEIER
jgi:hypothetical protein